MPDRAAGKDFRRQAIAKWAATQRRQAWNDLGLEREKLHQLLEYLASWGVDEEACDRTHRLTRKWAEAQGIDWLPLRDRLVNRGGACDCEVLANVDPDLD